MWQYRHDVLKDCQGPAWSECKRCVVQQTALLCFLYTAKEQTQISFTLENGSETIEG